ncbi:MAG TPA: hypothetical protein VMT93_03185 [Gemmatimonadaceae bacterium]|nr:hypothetical protein [Gemmatimonadaceae bacterium]
MRLTQRALVGIPPHDPATLTTVAALMLLGDTFARRLPFLRAPRIDPARAMQAQ